MSPMPDDDEALSRLIRRHGTRHRASDELRAAMRTQAALAEAKGDRTAAPGSAWWRAWGWRLAGPALGFAAGLMVALLVVPALQSRWPQAGSDIAAELVADHVAALREGAPFEVASSDRHTVKPWYQGRLDYAPPVADLADAGFPLAGGRVQRVEGQPMAALVYRRDRHWIDVFVRPSAERRAPVATRRRGFNVLHWSDGEMAWWAVSDVEAAELARLARHLGAPADGG